MLLYISIVDWIIVKLQIANQFWSACLFIFIQTDSFLPHLYRH